MKHGISPTTSRNRRWKQWNIVHLSKALVQRVIDFNNVIDGKVIAKHFPLHLRAPEGSVVKIVVAPDKGITYRRAEPKLERPGLRRRFALSGRTLMPARLGIRSRLTGWLQ